MARRCATTWISRSAERGCRSSRPRRRASRGSASLEQGFAFFKESNHAFLEVAGLATGPLETGLEIKLSIKTVFPTAANGLARHKIGLCRPPSQLRRAVLPMCLERVVGHRLPDHAPVAG